MGAHSTKSRATTSSLDKSLHPGRHANPDRLHLNKSMSSLPNKCLPDFETVGEKKKSKGNESENKLQIRYGPGDMCEANHKLPNNLASLCSTEVKPLYIGNPKKMNERSTVARISSKV